MLPLFIKTYGAVKRIFNKLLQNTTIDQ